MNIRGTARSLRISRNTIKRYRRLFARLKNESPYEEDPIGACLAFLKKREWRQREHPLFKVFQSLQVLDRLGERGLTQAADYLHPQI